MPGYLCGPRIFVTSLLLLLVAVPAHAQEVAGTFEALGNVLKNGENIFVTDQKGSIVTGTVTALSAASLELVLDGGSRRQWDQAAVREIRRRDPLTNGIAIGAGVGLGAGLAFGIPLGSLIENETGGGARATVTMAALGLAGGMAVGAVLDAAAKGPVLFRSGDGRTAIRLQPIVSSLAKGLQVSVRF